MHIPVLPEEVMEVLKPEPGKFFADGTVGGGGHTQKIIKKISPGGKMLAVDQDMKTLKKTKKKVENEIKKEEVKIYWFSANFTEIKEILKEKELGKLDGLLLDLGFSSMQIESELGFSFRKNEPLIMRYDRDVTGFTAARFLNEYSKKQISDVIYRYGEEKRARRIAEAIIKKRREEPLRTTGDLVEAIESAIPKKNSKIHPATKTFMAIRIFVNKELDSLEKILKDIPKIMKKSGRVAVISFHSLEDRIVKEKFKQYKKEGVANLINKKVIKPQSEEIKNNPRARSAKMRAIEIIV